MNRARAARDAADAKRNVSNVATNDGNSSGKRVRIQEPSQTGNQMNRRGGTGGTNETI